MYREWPSRIPGAVCWTGTADGDESLVLPDGCMDLIWIGTELVLAGPDRTAYRHRARAGTPFVGLRLPPGVLPALLGVPAARLVGQRVPAVEVGVRLSARDRGRALEDWAGARLDRVPGWLRYATAGLAGGLPVPRVALAAGMSERAFRRAALSSYGYGPKHLHRVLRLQRALGSGLPAAQAAQAVGCSDQAHLAREIRELTGSSWSALTS